MYVVLQMHENHAEGAVVVPDIETAQGYLESVDHNIPLQEAGYLYDACDEEGHGYRVLPATGYPFVVGHE